MPSPRIEVPSEIVQKWQEIVNLLAEIIHVPAALVMKLEPPNIKVFVSSESSGNPYEKDEVACFDPGLYCARVIKSQQQLLVPDALQDEEWKSNPDVKLGMISYLGFPIAWPDGQVFGTVCVLDDKRNAYTEPYRKFLLQCRDLLQTDLKLLTSAMREGEERFRLVANAAPVLIWMSGPDKLCNYFNQPWLEFTGRPIELELGNGWAEGVHPEDLERCLDTSTKAFDGRESFKVEYRLRRHDREYRWLLGTAVPRFNRDGSFAGYIGSCIDITERKRGEEALASVSRRLIEAQEQERTRIARELHDDIVQRLALLAVELEQLHQDLPNLPEIRSRIGELQQADQRDSDRYPNLVARVALVKTGISGHRGRHERLLQRIREAAESGDRLQKPRFAQPFVAGHFSLPFPSSARSPPQFGKTQWGSAHRSAIVGNVG